MDKEEGCSCFNAALVDYALKKKKSSQHEAICPVYQSHDNAMVIRTSSITAAFSNIVAATMPGLFYSDWNTSIPLRLAFIIVSVIWKTLSIIMSA